MRNEKIRYITAVSTMLVAMPITANANIVWPSLYIFSGMMSWYVILAGLIIEILFVKFTVKPSWMKSVAMAFGMNVASALIGLFLIPASGFFAAIVFGAIWNTFDLILWGISYVLAVFCNVFAEGLFLKLAFKLAFKKNFWWLLVANALSVVLAIAVLGYTMSGIRGF